MDVLTFETCWAVSSEIIKQVTSSWFLFNYQDDARSNKRKITRDNFEVTYWETWSTICLRYRKNNIISAACFTKLLLLQMWAVYMPWANMTKLRDLTRRTSEARDTNRYEWFALFFSFGPDIPYNIKKINLSHYRPEVPRGFQEVKVLTLRDNGPGWW